MQTPSSASLARPTVAPALLPEFDGFSTALLEAQIEKHSQRFSALVSARDLAEAKWNDVGASNLPDGATRKTDDTTPATDSSEADAALVRSARQGDRRAHLAIWRKYSPLVRSRIGRSVGGQDVEDHVQEVFLRLFEHLPQLRDPGALRSFIIGITLRVGGTELRRRRCRWWLAVAPTGELPEPPPSRDDGSDVREVLGTLLQILGKLTPHSSRVFELRYIEEKELTDVARAMKISLATAKRHLARASTCFFAMAEREPALADFMRSGMWRNTGTDLGASLV